MLFKALMGVAIPLLGTTLGAGCVFFMRNKISSNTVSMLNGFASGVMLAASVWSLLLPALDKASMLGHFSFIPAVLGLISGILFLMLLNYVADRVNKKNTSMLVLSVNIHNLPEGMAVGAVYAAWLSGISEISHSAALAVSIGIAIQNFPEGAIISMPLHSAGMGKFKSFLNGVASGVIEPVGAVSALLFFSLVSTALPYLLSFAAGAMIYVVIMELIPQIHKDNNSNIGLILFTAGFCVMMILDVVFG